MVLVRQANLVGRQHTCKLFVRFIMLLLPAMLVHPHIIEQKIAALKRGEIFLGLIVARNVRRRFICQFARATGTDTSESLGSLLVPEALGSHKRQFFAVDCGGYARCQQDAVSFLLLLGEELIDLLMLFNNSHLLNAVLLPDIIGTGCLSLHTTAVISISGYGRY